MNLVIKKYGSAGWHVQDESGKTFINKVFDNVDAAIEWLDRKYPEANTRVERQ